MLSVLIFIELFQSDKVPQRKSLTVSNNKSNIHISKITTSEAVAAKVKIMALLSVIISRVKQVSFKQRLKNCH